ncbi:hypothetical protein RHGRI_033954 [Rhododendron griersonianum]|uniref:non-specific serine/threonine protein kinase n=1 Tax=Rhododendron griersonianum TaxID=479676 RepID=A0AAV6I4I9_9ERIC|nr:hypothetical protein RHGRI_033954 [Rhododendron griersonianum]
MKHQSLSPLTPSLPFTIFIFFIKTSTISCGGSKYEACVPQNCGNQTIRYPFWIKNKQEPFCGYPGFELNCQNNNYPILQTPNNNYTIQEILYRWQTLRLSNTAVWNLKHDCWPPISNVSLEVDNFSVVSNGSDLYLLSNCSSLGENLLEYRIGCGEESRIGNGGLAMFGNDGNLGYGLQSCQTEVLAPVELVSGEVIRDYLSVLRRGFLVKWRAPDCSTCEDSGGRCGFDLVKLHFKCFCTDRPHSARCHRSVESVLSADSKYEACMPQNCGTGPNISYPFWILDKSEDFCGAKGFDVTCERNKPIYKTSGAHYLIEDISYDNQLFHLVNVEVLDTTCFAPQQNFSFDRSSLTFQSFNSDLLFFYNCSANVSISYPKRVVTCAFAANQTILNSFVTLVPRGKHYGFNALVPCESLVFAPVELTEENSSVIVETQDYAKLLTQGFSLEWSGPSCANCRSSGGTCGLNGSTVVCFCPDGAHSKHCNDVIPGGVVLVLSLLILTIRWRKKRNNVSYGISKNTSSDLERGSIYFGVSVFSYTELEEATNNFDASKELGDGGFGTVYHGILRDGREVAVKRLYEHNYKRVSQFMNEVEILTRLHHRNLVALYGCTSRQSKELLLVYEFIPNGTVADHLHGDRAKDAPLTWPIRMSIAIETAGALAYLHASDIIHRDVKTHNILVDDNFCVKVADFGLSRLFPTNVTHVSTAPQGTPGYVDPEYHQCYQLTDKSDVYSFGVVLIELISSMPAVDISRRRHEINLANWAINRIQNHAFNDLIDPSLGFQSDSSIERMAQSVSEVAFRCLQLEKEMRPTMEEVLEALKEIQEYKEEKSEGEATGKCMHPSPEGDHVVLLKNSKVPPSPDSVTGKFVSCSTTSFSSG